MEQGEKIKQAEGEGNYDTCPDCKKVVPVELAKYNPDEDDEENLIQCLICGSAIRFI